MYLKRARSDNNLSVQELSSSLYRDRYMLVIVENDTDPTCLSNVILTNSAFHPYGIDKSSTNLPGWGEGR